MPDGESTPAEGDGAAAAADEQQDRTPGGQDGLSASLSQSQDGEEREPTDGSSRRRAGYGRRRSRPPPLQIDPAAKTDDEEIESDWVPMQSRTQGRPYFYHTGTKETTWDKPADFDESLPEGATGWVEMESRTQGRWYYYNSRTKECSWTRPPGVAEPPPFERPTIDPRREYLREQIQVWASEFQEKHGRDPGEDDIPPDSDISRMHRDCRMLKEEAEMDKLKKEQDELRTELSPDSQLRLREIRHRLEDIEGPVLKWREVKAQERARRDEVTKAYNEWIKNFSDQHGRPPTERDIPPDSTISEMFQEYSVYREAARQAKARHAKAEDMKRQLDGKQRGDVSKAEFERLYAEFVSKLPRDSPTGKRERVKRLTTWIADFERKNRRPPTVKDVSNDADLLEKADAGRGKRRSLSGGVVQQPHKPAQVMVLVPQRTSIDGDAQPTSSPTSAARYESSKPPGCCQACVVM